MSKIMKKIPRNVQSLICASNQIINYSGAVKELVYNAIDADATSIAIRISIQENTIQVIDNGCGVSSTDINLIGQKDMTSKYINLSTLKSAPNTYGFRGQALANIISISKSVKIISRHENSEEIWMKLFEKGKEKLINKYTKRSSKGTTLEITGFLYNLSSIQKQSKDILNDLQNIQTFLEHLSLIHCNISLSLRDDSKNEIIFKIHKNRDIYQTLSTLYGLEKNNLRELRVEKNEYKAIAFVGKSEGTQTNLIFLNGKFITNTSKLHKIMNNNLKKCSNPRGLQKSKMKNMDIKEESNWISGTIPDYFIFLKCPYMDYDLNNFPKHSQLEFKDWEQINKLLEKLTKFFNGDMNLREDLTVDKNEACEAKYSDTREEVKKIMQKIMGTHSKKPGISHMHNTIMGKQAKRQSKKLPLKSTARGSERKKKDENNSKPIDKIIDIDNYNHSNKIKEGNKNKKQLVKKYSKANSNTVKLSLEKIGGNKNNSQLKKNSKNDEITIPPITMLNKAICKKKKSRIDKDIILRKFEMKTASVKKRYDKLEKKTKLLMEQMHKQAFNKFANENIAIKSNVPKKHINISVRKQIDEIIIHDNTAKRLGTMNDYNCCKNLKNKPVQSNYDLLQTIIKTQEENIEQIQNIADESNQTSAMNSPKIAIITEGIKGASATNKEPENTFAEPMITFKSHNYYTNQNYVTENNNFNSHTHYQKKNQNDLHNRPRTFITRQSRDNFVIPKNVFKSKHFNKRKSKTGLALQFQSHIKNLFKQTSKLFNLKKHIMGNTCESSYTIEFSESNSHRVTNNKDVIVSDMSRNTRMTIEETLPHSGNHANEHIDHIFINTGTNVVPNVDDDGNSINDDEHCALRSTYTIEKTNQAINNTEFHNHDNSITDNSENKRNFIFVSNSEEHNQNEEIIDPMDVCQTILTSENVLDKEFALSFNTEKNYVSNNHICSTNFKRNHDDTRLYSGLKNITEDHNINALDKINEVSHHFTPNKSISAKVANKSMNPSPILTLRQNTKGAKELVQENNTSKIEKDSRLDGFNIINRLCFLPKGMSPIFQNCQTKYVCEYNLSRDYYEKEMYNNFAKDVRNNAEIYEPNIQNAKEIATKAIDKVNAKLNRDSSELKFDGQSLNNAKILGQIDDKFIAATMKEGHKVASTNYLVLFDQHAVHERIRLENNLTDYFNDNHWKEVEIDALLLILSNDDVLYLHNYKDKFEQLGLRWTVMSANEVSIRAIPEAVLGKNPRQVEKVIKAVKNLIIEEINIIKVQGGCFSLYPKSIMDLVSSEACRYAIKFGDKLSKRECAELLKALSDCKTPFQCAHGRPVMAVIMETEPNTHDYKINLDKTLEWKRKFGRINSTLFL